MANNKKKIDQLPNINVSNAGDYFSNLVNAYNNYRAGREERRDNFRQAVQQGADQLYSNLPENVQNGLNTAGDYLDKATGIGSMTEYLKRVDDYMRNQIISPAANYADKIYGKMMENYQPESRMPNTEGISGITEPVQAKKSRAGESDYYANISNKVNNQTIATQPKQRMMKNGGEGGDGSETGGEGESKPITVEDYNVWSKLQEQKQSIVDAYDANVDYAKQIQDSAYQRAEDAYKVAAREAQGNYEANKPTYGLAAEQMYKSGLTGSGYSDYLAGKAMEARTGEINAARSQQAAAQIAADDAYNKFMHEALANKISQENAFAEDEKEYLAAYNIEINNAIANIMDGLWDASVAEAYLNRYAPGGAIDQETRAMIQQAMTNYNKATYNSVTSALLEYLNGELKAGNPISEESVRRWLVDNAPGITDTQINAYLSGYFKDGRLNTDLVLGETQSGSTTTNPNNPESGAGGQGGSGGTNTENTESTENTGNTGTTGNSGTTNPEDNYTAGEVIAGAGMGLWDWLKNLFGGNKKDQGGADQGGADQGGLEDEVATAKPNSYEETLDLFSSEVIKNHDAKDVDWYKKQLENLGNEAFDQDAAAKIKNMANGYVVSSGKFEGNTGARTNFQNGDNFSVTIGGQSYRVESQGLAGDRAREAAKDLPDGVVFGYGSELYIKVGSTAYKIGPRPGVGNGDYDRLWRSVYQEQIANIKAGTEGNIANEGANTDTLSATEKVQNWARNIQNNVEQAKNNALSEAEKAQKEMIDKFTPNTGMTDILGEAIDENKAAEEEKVESTPPYSDPGGGHYQDVLLNPGVNLDDFPEVNRENESAWDKLLKWFASVGNAVQKTENQVASGINSATDTVRDGVGGALGAIDQAFKDADAQRKENRLQREAERAEQNKQFIENYNNFVQSIEDGYNEASDNMQNGIDNALATLIGWADALKPKTTEEEKEKTNLLEAIQNIRLGTKAFVDKNKEAVEEDREIGRGVANYERDGMFDRNLTKGDNFTVEVAGKSYKVESRGEVNDEELISAANDAGIHNGEVFTFGKGTYLKQGDKFYEVGQRALAPNQDEALRIAIKNNSGNVVTDYSVNSMKDQDVYLSGDPRRGFKTMDKVELSDGNGNSYKLQIRAVLGEGSAAYEAGRYVDNGEAYIHGNDIYVKYGENAYKLAAVGGNKNGDYDRLAERLGQNNHFTNTKAGDFLGAAITTDAKSNIPGAGKHTNYKLDKEGNIKHSSINSVINVVIGDSGYAMKKGDITTGGAYRAGQSNSAEVGEIYAWGGKLYMYLGDGALELKSRGVGGSALGYFDLLDYILENNDLNAN